MEAWRQELYLAHHGIKGQRWGVQKGPPYPLDAKDHSAAEKKAGWRQSLSSTQKRPPATKAEDEADKPVENKPQMSLKTKKMLTTTATVAALGVIGAVAVSNPKVRELAKTGMKAANDIFSKEVYQDYRSKSGYIITASAQKEHADFERQLNAVLKEMADADKRSVKAQARDLKLRRRNERAEREQFFKSLAEAQRKAAEERKREISRQQRIDIAKRHQGTNRFGDLMISDLLMLTV